MQIDSFISAGNTQSSGTFTHEVSSQASAHQVTLVTTGTVTAGTATLKARAAGGSVYESVVDSAGAPVSISMTAPSSILFDGVIDSIKITPTGFDAGASYAVNHFGFTGE